MRVKRQPDPQVRSRCDFAAVVLAAGAGSRFGGAKLTAPWRGGILLDGALATAFEAPVETVVVVSGADPGVIPAARAFAERRGAAARLRLTGAEDWAQGLSASLKAGLAAVPQDCRAAYLLLGDMPDIPKGLTARLAAAFVPGVGAVAPDYEGRPGHPALLSADLFPAAMALSGDRGARPLMEAQGVRFVRLPALHPGVLFDVDTREALEGASTPASPARDEGA